MSIKRKIEIVLCACLVASTAINAYLVFGRRAGPAKSLREGQIFPSLRTASVVTEIGPSAASKQRRVYYWFSPICSFCKKNQQSAAQLAHKLPRGEFVGISTTSSELAAYIKAEQIEFPILALPAEDSVLTKMGATPTTFVVNSNGIVEKMWVGAYIESTRLEIRPYFGVSLPSLVTGVQSRTGIPVRATPRP